MKRDIAVTRKYGKKMELAGQKIMSENILGVRPLKAARNLHHIKNT